MIKIKNWVTDNPKKFKRILLLFIIILVILLSGISANASTLSDKLGDPTQYIAENGYDINNYPYYYIYQTSSGEYRYVFSKQPVTYRESNSSDFTGELVPGKGNSYTTNIQVDYLNGSFNDFEAYKYRHKLVNYTYMCYSNHNIKYENESERVFFYASPSSKIPYQLIGGQISTQMVVNLMTKEILTILPFLLVLVVSLMALRKALATIFRLLRKA